jgi:hypothetical protein
MSALEAWLYREETSAVGQTEESGMETQKSERTEARNRSTEPQESGAATAAERMFADTYFAGMSLSDARATSTGTGADSALSKNSASDFSKEHSDSISSQRSGDRWTSGSADPEGNSNSTKDRYTGNDHSGIVTTYDEDGNPTSDCHGRLPRGKQGSLDLRDTGRDRLPFPPHDHKINQPRLGLPSLSIVCGDENKLLSPSSPSAGNDRANPATRADDTPAIPTHAPRDTVNTPTNKGAAEILFQTGGDRAQAQPLSEKQLEESSRKIIDTIEKSGNLGDEAQRKAIADLLKQAASQDSLPDLIGKLNAELAKKGLDYRFSMQNMTETEITMDGPTFRYNNFNVSLKSVSTGNPVDRVRFQTKSILDREHRDF